MVNTITIQLNTAHLWTLLQKVKDPEVPVLTILDLGIIRNITFENNKYSIFITPTYSGCPAMDTIAINIKLCLFENQITNFEIKQQLSPAWSSAWISETGKQKLKEFGIAPPQYKNNLEDEAEIICPLCNSKQTSLVSQFGSTSCKALYKCATCLEPFDYFKCH
jgi:ring-1,2-phenylacetyl-CoA epoxidase subunit PaaD